MIYDLIIIGLGPAGVTAGIYANRYELKTLILGKEMGGMANEAFRVENYPGFKSLAGIELMGKFKENLDYLKVPYQLKDIEKIEKTEDGFKVFTGDEIYQAKAVILATGTEVKRLNIPGERELAGKGVSYCATCDGQFFKNKTVAVIGAGDAGATTCLMLSGIAKKIYWVYIEEEPIAMPFWLEKLEGIDKIEKISQNILLEIKGEKKVEKIILDKEHQGKKEIEVDGVFVLIGVSPVANLVKDLGINLDKAGHVVVDEKQETNKKGFFAAGDVTTSSYRFKQIITACSEGAIAAFGAYQYIKGIKINRPVV
ncbi:MAG: thioredoxin reductase (NADPH) [Parcubacteria group bacterium Athens1014_10]|nr:MAG: thioredoxin reductase (NADPH) [Parcubacteria group bacterium Athens1014_10]TSD05005.1 MAG: thioredoxin reductase (NADPH) [Parcubacteria group bacterium Athens0714_12]